MEIRSDFCRSFRDKYDVELMTHYKRAVNYEFHCIEGPYKNTDFEVTMSSPVWSRI